MPEDSRELWTRRFRNVALGLHRRFVFGVALAFTLVILGSVAVGVAELYPQSARWTIRVFLVVMLIVTILLWKSRRA